MALQHKQDLCGVGFKHDTATDNEHYSLMGHTVCLCQCSLVPTVADVKHLLQWYHVSILHCLKRCRHPHMSSLKTKQKCSLVKCPLNYMQPNKKRVKFLTRPPADTDWGQPLLVFIKCTLSGACCCAYSDLNDGIWRWKFACLSLLTTEAFHSFYPVATFGCFATERIITGCFVFYFVVTVQIQVLSSCSAVMDCTVH